MSLILNLVSLGLSLGSFSCPPPHGAWIAGIGFGVATVLLIEAFFVKGKACLNER